MSSYNNVVKIKYTDDLSEAVSLDEYVIFADDKNQRKYIVFKFYNNVNQHLFGLKFEVSQYDTNNELIEKSVVVYKDFNAEPNSAFVPKARLKANYQCQRVSVRLVQAAFDRVLWNEGSYVDNSYKFEHYARDEKYIEEKNRPVQAPPASPKKKREAAAYNARFHVANITKKNVAKGPAVYYWIFCILIVAAIIASVFVFRARSDEFTVQGYDLKKIGGSEVSICGYEGEETEIKVPAEIEGFTVKRIAQNAFSNLPVKSIVLPTTINAIETGAFNHLENLKSVEMVEMKDASKSAVDVKSKAFEDCPSLTKFSIPNAEMAVNSLYGCSKVSILFFGHTKAERLLDLFGEKRDGITLNFVDGTYDTDAATFFDGVT